MIPQIEDKEMSRSSLRSGHHRKEKTSTGGLDEADIPPLLHVVSTQLPSFWRTYKSRARRGEYSVEPADESDGSGLRKRLSLDGATPTGRQFMCPSWKATRRPSPPNSTRRDAKQSLLI